MVELRAAVVLGSGSISFEMLRYLTERLPAMVCPQWISTRIQPIAEADLMDRLVDERAAAFYCPAAFDGPGKVLCRAEPLHIGVDFKKLAETSVSDGFFQEQAGIVEAMLAHDAQQNADPTDYSVAKDDTVVVATAETLGHYADWLRVSAVHLRQLNKLGYGKPVIVGRKVHLDFHRVTHEEFEQKRREYHQTLQASYFASHRIVGTEVYIARRGDSMWTITQRFAQLPVWLIQQYNPDLDLADLHPGTQIVMPRVEPVVAGGGE